MRSDIHDTKLQHNLAEKVDLPRGWLTVVRSKMEVWTHENQTRRPRINNERGERDLLYWLEKTFF